MPQPREAAEQRKRLVGDAEAAGESDLPQREAGDPRQPGVGDGRFVDRQAGQLGKPADERKGVVIDLISAEPQRFQPLERQQLLQPGVGQLRIAAKIERTQPGDAPQAVSVRRR